MGYTKLYVCLSANFIPFIVIIIIITLIIYTIQLHGQREKYVYFSFIGGNASFVNNNDGDGRKTGLLKHVPATLPQQTT